MYSTIIPIALSGLALAGAQTTGQLGNAKVVTDNPAGASYRATLPPTMFNKKTGSVIKGYVAAQTASGGKGVTFNINLYDFPSSSLGPFLYHIHAHPVPADGNCTATGAHLDPFLRGEMPPCDSAHPETCQVGDLAGKHGKIPGGTFQASYTDIYVSDSPASNASLVGKSIVIHSSNTTRLTCANFEVASSGTSNSTSSSNTTASSSSTPSPFVGAATVNAATVGTVMIAGLMSAAAFFL